MLRALKTAGFKQYEIASLCGVSEGHLSVILRGKKRRSAAGETRSLHGNAKLTEEKVHEAHRLFEAGQNYADIARVLGVSDATIRDAIVGNTWKKIFAARRGANDPA